MNRFLFSILTILNLGLAQAQNKTERKQNSSHQLTNIDWLVTPITQKAKVYTEGKNIILNNGLVRRSFRISPNVACTDFTNLTNDQQLIRAVKPEAKITLDGKEYAIGGLRGQKENAYLLPEWVDKMEVGKEDFTFVNYTISEIKPYINWKSSN